MVGDLRSQMLCGQKPKHKQYYNKFNKDFTNGPHKKKSRKELLGIETNFDEKKINMVQHLKSRVIKSQSVIIS